MAGELIQCIFSNEQKVTVQTVLISGLASQPTQGGVSPAKPWLDTPWVKPEVSLMTYRAWHLPASLELVAKLPHSPSPPRQWCHTGTGLPTAPHAACPSHSLKSSLRLCSDSVQTQSSTNLALLVLLCLLFCGMNTTSGFSLLFTSGDLG